MQVTLKISPTKEVPYAVKGKTYDEAADFIVNRKNAACYQANPTYVHTYKDRDKKTGMIASVVVTAKPTIDFPNWPGASKLKGEEKKCWDAMIKALRKHEANHHKIFVADSNAFKKDMEKKDDLPVKDFDKAMKKYFTDSQGKQLKYDAKTKNGQTEGVDLPYLN